MTGRARGKWTVSIQGERRPDSVVREISVVLVMRWQNMSGAFKIYSRDHHGIATPTEMSCVLQFLGEEIAGINNARNVRDVCNAKVMRLADIVFLEINVFGSFGCDGGGPINICLIIIVYSHVE